MNEIDELEDILDAIIKGVQDALQSGETLSPELQDKIAQEITYLIQEIDTLHSTQQEAQIELQEAEAEQAEVAQDVSPPEEPPAPPSEPIPELSPTKHPSSNINAFRYDPKTSKLYIKYQDKYPSQNGPVYSYEGVPPFIFNALKKGSVPPKTSGSNAWHTWTKGKTPSHGASVIALIQKNGYPYQKLS